MLPALVWKIVEIVLVICIVIKIFTKLTMGWCKSNTCLVGKTVVITGGNSGLGYQTALALAGRGARIIIGDVANTAKSIDTIKEETGNPNVIGKFLDLSSLDSVREFCDEIKKEESRLDILINNAGVGGLPLSHTKDGLQIHMQVNYFGHFLLTHLLIDMLKPTKGRIIFVSSAAVYDHNLNLENLNNPTMYSDEKRTHWKIYCNSKLCELIASNILAEKLKPFGITSNAVYPGFVVTPIIANMVDPNFEKWNKKIVYFIFKMFGKSAYEGAQTQINCALSRNLQNTSGEFFVDCIPFYQPKLAKDNAFCRKLWEVSEKLVKLQPDEKLK